MSDYYSVLGLSKEASESEIKKAFKKKAMQFHPDRNPGDKEAEESFKKVNEAYAVLSDPSKRKQYDMFGEQGFHQRYSQEDIFKGTDFGRIFDEMGFGGNIFSQIFGGGFQQGPSRGQDVEYPITIGFMDAFSGSERSIQFSLQGGVSRSLNVKIPAGIATGAKLRVAGRGAPSASGGPDGDLYLVITVSEHPKFRRQGSDIETDLNLKLSEAILGTTVEVETLDGTKRLKIPAGIQNGTKMRLRGLGFPIPKSSRGDLFARVVVDVPKDLNQEQKQAVEALQNLGL